MCSTEIEPDPFAMLDFNESDDSVSCDESTSNNRTESNSNEANSVVACNNLVSPSPIRRVYESTLSKALLEKQQKELLEELSDDEYYATLESLFENRTLTESDLHFESLNEDKSESCIETWTEPKAKNIEIQEDFATLKMNQSLHLEKKALKCGLLNLLNKDDPSLREIWGIYFGEKSPVLRALMQVLEIDYQTCLRFLSTTAVLQGNRWSITDYASEYNVANYNKLKVSNNRNQKASFTI